MGSVTNFQGGHENLTTTRIVASGPAIRRWLGQNVLYLQGRTIDHGFLLRPEGLEAGLRLQYYRELEDIVNMFRFAPVLHIKDVELLFKKAKTGSISRPNPCELPISGLLQSVIGAFSSIDALLKCVQERGARVAFEDSTPEKPFKLVRSRQILLERRQNPDEKYLVMTQELINSLRPNSRKILASDMRTSQAADVSLKPTSKYNAAEVREQYMSEKRRRHQDRASLINSLQAQCRYVDGKRNCELPGCPLPGQRPSSNFCVYHTEKLLEHLEAGEKRESRMAKWQLNSKRLDSDAQKDLQALKEVYTKSPNRTWIIDFEFATLGGMWSPIPLQLAIRTFDGKLLLADNVEYNLNLEGFLAQIAAVGSVPQSLSAFFTRCYGALKTNGRTPREMRYTIVKKLKYNKDKINILSWFSVQDMQCFQRIINAEDDELIVPRHTHLTCANFQSIKLSLLLKGLLPPAWPSLQLGVVHTSLLRSQGRRPNRLDYHTAEYDTEAVADLVKEIVSFE